VQFTTRRVPGAAAFYPSGRESTLAQDYGRLISPGGVASLGNISQSRAAAAPTVVAAPTALHPVSQATIDRLLGKTK
jgi:hypothetical protein